MSFLNISVYNMVVEMPRWTNAKNEITKEEKLNPIIQDTKIYGKVIILINCMRNE